MRWLKLLRKLTYLKRGVPCCVLTQEGQPSHGRVQIHPGKCGQFLGQCVSYSLRRTWESIDLLGEKAIVMPPRWCP